MKSRLSILISMTALAVVLVANIQAQTTNPPYLSQFPSVERIKADVRGVDAMETAAKQAGIFWQLHQLIYSLAYSQRRTDRQFTPDEQRLEVEYRNARYSAVKPFGEPDYRNPKWLGMYSRYEHDRVLLDEVFKKYFTPELRRSVYVDLKMQIPTGNPPKGSTLTPTGTAPASNNSTITPPSGARPAAQPGAGGSADDYAAQGKKYYDAKDYAKAIEAFKKSIAIKPTLTAYNRLGYSYYDLKQYLEALGAFKQALSLKPDDVPTLSNVGSAYFEMGEYENAIIPLQEAIRLKPGSDADVYNVLGVSYYYLEKFPEAEAAYQQAIRLKPADATYLMNLGNTYVYMRRKADAMQIYQQLQKLDQAKAKALNTDIGIFLNTNIDAKVQADGLFVAGNNFLSLRAYDEALQAYYHAIALKLDPSYLDEAHYGKGRAFVGLKRYGKAVAEFREAIRLDPKKPEYHKDLGKTYLAMGQKAQAQQVYNTLLTLDKQKAQELYAEINKSK